jgi:hypothetical protein
MKRKYTGKIGDKGSKAMKTIEAKYPYLDAEEDLLFQKVRFYPKSFAYRRPREGGGWTWDINGIELVLYRLPQVMAAHQVVITEGEKDADAVCKLGLVGTTSPGGAGKWDEKFSQALTGKQVVVLQDDDKPGRKHARAVAQSVARYASEVRLVPPFPNSKDVSEWIAKGGTVEQFKKLTAATSIYKPSADSPIALEIKSEPPNPAVPVLKGSKLVRKLELFFNKRVILPSGLSLVIALWAIGTYLSVFLIVFPTSALPLLLSVAARRCSQSS